MGRELPQSTREQQQQQGDRGRVPMALKQELADRLANMDQTEMIDALQIVRDCEHSDLINAHGELEVDFDVLTDFTLWHLYDFTKRSAQTANGVANDRPTQASPPTMRAGSMPRALMDELVHRLVHLNESDMNDVLQIVRDCEDLDLTNADGEVELDFDALEFATLWKLYDFTERSAYAANGVAPEMPSPVTSPQA